MPWRAAIKDNKKRNQGGLANERNDPPPKRPRRLGAYIMDGIHKHGEEECGRVLNLLQDRIAVNARHSNGDPDLEAPYEDAVRRAAEVEELDETTRFNEELEAIRDSVRSLWKAHKADVSSTAKKVDGPQSPRKKSGAGFTDMPIEQRQDKLRRLSLKFHQPITVAGTPIRYMSFDEVLRVKASYAFKYDCEEAGAKRFTHFPWDVAFRELCAIKARTKPGGSKTVRMDFYENMAVKVQAPR